MQGAESERAVRILVLGITGFVGSAVAPELSRRGHEVWGVARGAVASEGLAEHLAASRAVDLGCPDAVDTCLDWARPAAVLNLAAVPDIGPCRDDPGRAWTLNAEVPHALAGRCASRGVRLVHVSTDQVFDGSRGPWREGDRARPLHLYGETKRAGERAVLQTDRRAAVVRPALVTGAAPPGRRSSTSALLDALVRGERPRMFTDEIRSPIAVGDLARALADLVERVDGDAGWSGLFHAGGPEALSRFELALREASAAGLDTGSLVPGTRAEAGLADRRPADLGLDSTRLWTLRADAPARRCPCAALEPPPVGCRMAARARPGRTTMKTFILLPTGIADVPVEGLGGATPLEVARTPNLDRMAREGRVGLVRQVPEGLRIGSDVAVLSVLGYDPRLNQVSRGALEAAGMGVALRPDDLAFRMNFVSTFRGHLVDFSAGHINSVEARLLVEALQQRLGGGRYSFHPGVGYRNLLVIHGGLRGGLRARGGPASDGGAAEADDGVRRLAVETVPPQEVQGQAFADYLPYGPDADELNQLIEVASEVLAAHDVNRVRVDLGENPADRIWLWGAGWHTDIEPFELRHRGARLAVVAAVPLVRGLGALMGATVPTVPGATGYYDTDYAAKLRAGLAALEDHDVVLLHVAAANEACHETDVRLKVRVIEEVDRCVVGPALKALAGRDDVRVLVTTDHMTSTVVGMGSTDHVPFCVWGAQVHPVRAGRFTEVEAAGGELHVEDGHSMLEYVMGGQRVQPAASGRPAATTTGRQPTTTTGSMAAMDANSEVGEDAGARGSDA